MQHLHYLEEETVDYNDDDIYNVPQFENKQSGAVNQNAQSSHFCIAWNCYQTTTTTQSVTADDSSPLVYGKNNDIVTSSTTERNTLIEDDGEFVSSTTTQNSNGNGNSKEKFNIDITIAYTKPYSQLKNEHLVVTVTPESGKRYEKNIELSKYTIDGTPIDTRFTFGNGEVDVGDNVHVCVESISSTTGHIGTTCKVVTNGPEHKPESVTLVIPKR